MPDCFPVQYKFLYCDGALCFLKEGTVPSVRELGPRGEDGWTERKKKPLICSHHGEAMATYIKASFRSPRLISVDGRPAVWTEREHQVCSSKKARRHSPNLDDGRVEWTGGSGGDGTFGDFCQKHERAFVLGGTQRSEG